ncbi:hypothetical protein UlMin_013185 [Ulmus minor]
METDQPESFPSSSAPASAGDGPSSSSQPSASQIPEEVDERPENENHSELPRHLHYRHRQRTSILSYRVSGRISEETEVRDEVWSCLVVLVTFWFFASMTLILGFYGSSNLLLGPNCSRLIRTNPFFVRSIQVQELEEIKPGPVLYGFHEPPPLDVEIAWTETHNTFVPSTFHKEWIYFFNNGSKIDISFSVKTPNSPPLLLVIAKGRQTLVEWIEDPSYPNTTLSWNIIHGSGKIMQEIFQSSNYYIAVGNLNSEEVEVELEFTINSWLYNTARSFYQCNLGNRLCILKLSLGAKVAVLTSPGHNEDTPDDHWYVKLSYGPQWLVYFIGSGLMSVIILLAFRFCNMFLNRGEHRIQFEPQEGASERAPLLLSKDDDVSSWGSSYDSVSNDEEDLEGWQVVSSSEGRPMNEGESTSNNNPGRNCVICFNSPRDCFFLPCGHCAACVTCGKRIAEEIGSCPICRRKMKKVRKIFTV